MIPHIITADNLTFIFSGEAYTFHSSYPDYQDMIEAVEQNDEQTCRGLIRKFTETLEFLGGAIYSKHGVMYIRTPEGDKSIDHRLHSRISAMNASNDSESMLKSLIKFTSNLYENPHVESIQDMYRFLDHNQLPLTDDGCFIAYKLVRADYKDIRTGTMDNSVGQIVSMPRECVEFDRETTCSSGLHFCSRGYLPHYGDMNSRIMILKINPRDVVSIPIDYNNAKGRACQYEVIGELPNDKFLQESIDEVESSIVVKVGNLLNKIKSFFTRG